MANILWLRHIFDRFHSGISTFRESHPPKNDEALRIKTYSRHHADMSKMPEEKSSLRPPRVPELDARPQSSKDDSITRQDRRDVVGNTDVPSEEDVRAEEREHQRYGEAQPQLVPTDVIETMLTARGRNKDSLDGV
ncbi:hypothetical protein J3F83DRAFT_754766 [Trichoderma novae-zelandiae]